MKEDIIRSFAARIEMHCDSLVEEEIGSPDGWFTSFIHYTSYYNGLPFFYHFLCLFCVSTVERRSMALLS